jgi:hypothetical protein
MPGDVTFLRVPRSKPKTSAEGQEQLSTSLARMASAPAASKRVPITEIGFGQCRFVVDDRNFPALCCGEPTLGGSWCAQHRALVFVRVAAPNHRKSAQEPVKALADAPKAAPVPNGPARLVKAQQTKADNAGSPPAAKPKPKPEQTPSLDRREGTPAKGDRRPAGLIAKKDGAEALRGAAPRKEASTARGAGKQAGAVSGKPSAASVPVKKSEPVRKSAKTPSPPAKMAASARKGSAAKGSASVKKATATRKSSAAKRPAPAKKAAASRKSGAGKSAAAKKATPLRKGTAAKRTAPAKKAGARRKRR